MSFVGWVWMGAGALALIAWKPMMAVGTQVAPKSQHGLIRVLYATAAGLMLTAGLVLVVLSS